MGKAERTISIQEQIQPCAGSDVQGQRGVGGYRVRHDYNKEELHNTYYAPGTMLSSFHILIHLIIIKIIK